MAPTTEGLDFPSSSRPGRRQPAPELALALQATARGWSAAELRLALLTAVPLATAGEVEAIVAAVARVPRRA